MVRDVASRASEPDRERAIADGVDCLLRTEQASWVCQCEDSLVRQLEQDFKLTLQQQTSLEQWAAWLDSVVGQVLEPFQGRPELPRAARQFLLKWSFYRCVQVELHKC
ncbi:hypothetical protein HPB52_008976 [Rhipicephalus sanguineus]|uniref:RFX1-4/6/8-like BCD domain-containing protein n=1 Tax=Rhipicephalus sanguineus TaxID=34632 RepID=A0A9D4PC15_RHISA|nr:hypothetical protein HPB52_008976 [Rhipicephalus sanguineus]